MTKDSAGFVLLPSSQEALPYTSGNQPVAAATTKPSPWMSEPPPEAPGGCSAPTRKGEASEGSRIL